MKKMFFLTCLIFIVLSVDTKRWQPVITEKEYAITPQLNETCYQYAQRKVHEMIDKYSKRRIVGSIWLSEYWAHHYYGAIEYRNYTWKEASGGRCTLALFKHCQ